MIVSCGSIMLSAVAIASCMASETLVARIVSPDGRYQATVIDVNGGATTSIATQVVIRESILGLRRTHVVFVADDKS